MTNAIDGTKTVRRFFQDRDPNKPLSSREVATLKRAIGADNKTSVKERIELLKNLEADFSIRDRFTPTEKSLVHFAMEGIDTFSTWEALTRADRGELLEKAFTFDGEIAGVSTKTTDVSPNQLGRLHFGKASQAISDALSMQLKSELAQAKKDGRALYLEAADFEVMTISHRNAQTGRNEVYGYELTSRVNARPRLDERGLLSVSYEGDNYFDAEGRALTRNPVSTDVQFLGD